MKLLRLLNRVLLKLASVLAIVFMAIIAIVIPYEVFCRYVLNTMSIWSTELTMFSLVWVSMMGGAVGLDKGYHVGITTLTDNLPAFPAKLVKGVAYILVMVFLAIMVYYGIIQVISNQSQVSSSMGIPMSLPYIALPLGFFVMFFITIEHFLNLLGFGAKRGK